MEKMRAAQLGNQMVDLKVRMTDNHLAASLVQQSADLMAVSLDVESDEMKVRMTADLMEKMMATKSGYLLEVLDIHKKGAALLALL